MVSICIQNKNQKQRIVIFVCSPLENESLELVKAAKRLKKEKINVDVFSFGESDFNKVLIQM